MRRNGKFNPLTLIPANGLHAVAQKRKRRKKRRSGKGTSLLSRNKFWTVVLWIVFLPVLLFLGVGIVWVIIKSL